MMELPLKRKNPRIKQDRIVLHFVRRLAPSLLIVKPRGAHCLA